MWYTGFAIKVVVSNIELCPLENFFPEQEHGKTGTFL